MKRLTVQPPILSARATQPARHFELKNDTDEISELDAKEKRVIGLDVIEGGRHTNVGFSRGALQQPHPHYLVFLLVES